MKTLEVHVKTNKIIQTTREEDVMLYLVTKYREMNKYYDNIKMISERDKFLYNEKVSALQKKVSLLEDETGKNLKESIHLEHMIKEFKEKIKTDSKDQEQNKNSFGIDSEADNFQQDSNIDHMSSYNDYATVDNSFQDCLPIDKELKIESLIKKLDSFLTDKSDESTLKVEFDKMQEQLTKLIHQSAIDKQFARNASLNIWKLEKQLTKVEREKNNLNQKIQNLNIELESSKNKCNQLEIKFIKAQETSLAKENVLNELRKTIEQYRIDKDGEKKLRVEFETKFINERAETAKLQHKVLSVEKLLENNQQQLTKIQKENQHLNDLNELLNQNKVEMDSKYFQIKKVAELTEKEYNNLLNKYQSLTMACSITEKQISELETRFKDELNKNKSHNEKIHKLEKLLEETNKQFHQTSALLKEKDILLNQNNKKLSILNKEINELLEINKTLQQTNLKQEQEYVKLSTEMSKLQVIVKHLNSDIKHLNNIKVTYETEIVDLKENYSKVLSELYNVKEDLDAEKEKQISTQDLVKDLIKEINYKEGVIDEQKSCQTKMDVKSATVIAQYKKIIELLQDKVEHSEKKKKGITKKLFG